MVRPVACLLAGLAAGWAATAAGGPGHDPVPAVDDSPHSPKSPEPDEPAATIGDRIDAAVREGRYGDGLELIQEAGSDEPALAYREALCLEGLGRWRDAAAAYHRADAADADLAALGQARCAIAAGDAGAAGELIARCAARPTFRGKWFADELRHLRIRLDLARRPTGGPDPLDATALAWPSWRCELDRYLAGPSASDTAPADDPAESAPDHPLAADARLAAANLDFAAGRLRDAAAGYKELLQGTARAELLRAAAYNLGLLHLRLGDTAAAAARLLEVVDRADGDDWAGLGWWWIGRTHLDAGDARAAVKPLLNALDGRSKEARSAAALGLCAAYVLLGEDEDARELLRRHRLAADDRHAAAGEFFEAMFRYRNAPSEGRATGLRAAARDGRLLGPAGVYLAGQAYREAGSPAAMAALYESALPTARGPLAVRMTFAVAEYEDDLDRRAAARVRYAAVAAADTGGSGATAELRLAGLALRDGRADECLRRCRAAAGRGADPADVLPLMGRAFERSGQHLLAAECFAGRLPQEGATR